MVEILEIRDALNRLPFKDGRRQVFIGRISDAIALPEPEDNEVEAQEQVEFPTDPPAVTNYLASLEAKLRKHDLALARGDEDRDALFAVQELRRQHRVDLSWLAAAYAWSGKIMTVGLEMVLPGVAGMWLDGKLGTNFLAPVGFAFGVLFGFWHLMYMTRSRRTQ